MNLTRIDKLIIVLIVLASIASIPVALSAGSSDQGSELTVYRAGQKIASYDLVETGMHKIAGSNGGYCLLQIKNGKAFIQRSTCPHKICQKQGQISDAGQAIICAPMRLMFEVKSQVPSRLDAIND